MPRAAWLPSLIGVMALGAGTALAQAPAATAAMQAETVSTATLASICAAATRDSESALTAYCRGFMIGAGQYHLAIAAARGGQRIFCLPEPGPSMEAVQVAFVEWARANTQHGAERAVDGLMRFAATTYPCPPAATPAAAPRSRSR